MSMYIVEKKVQYNIILSLFFWLTLTLTLTVVFILWNLYFCCRRSSFRFNFFEAAIRIKIYLYIIDSNLKIKKFNIYIFFFLRIGK